MRRVESERQAGRGETDIATTSDAFLGGRLKITQPAKGPRAGIDAIFLAAAVPVVAGKRQRILEAGAAHGVASLSIAARVSDAAITCVEIEPRLAALARENAALNGFAGRVDVAEADITAPAAQLEGLGLARHSFDHVCANPPYYSETRSRPAEGIKRRAHAAPVDALERWIKFLTRMAGPGASLTLIHRADALAEILAAIDRRFGALILFPLFPRAGEPATRIIVSGIKDSKAPLALATGLILHGEGNAFTRQADAILREGRALRLR